METVQSTKASPGPAIVQKFTLPSSFTIQARNPCPFQCKGFDSTVSSAKPLPLDILQLSRPKPRRVSRRVQKSVIPSPLKSSHALPEGSPRGIGFAVLISIPNASPLTGIQLRYPRPCPEGIALQKSGVPSPSTSTQTPSVFGVASLMGVSKLSPA